MEVSKGYICLWYKPVSEIPNGWKILENTLSADKKTCYIQYIGEEISLQTEEKLFAEYMKDWCDLYVHFCWHKNQTPKQCWDRNIFKEHFTFEKWKKGFTEVNTLISSSFLNKEVEGVKLENQKIRVRYKIFHFVAFGFKYTID